VSRTVVDAADLERRVKDMYTRVALDPHGQFHFEMGGMARRLGYTDAELDAAPAASIESFAGVGYYFDLADLHRGEQVVDLGSGSTGRPIAHSPRSLHTIRRRFTPISWRCGVHRIKARSRTGPQLTPSTRKWWRSV
jgi:hypothetical protein